MNKALLKRALAWFAVLAAALALANPGTGNGGM